MNPKINTNKYYRTTTTPLPKNIQLNIFGKTDPRADGMLDSISNDASKISDIVDYENICPKKSVDNKKIQKNTIISSKKNNIPVVRHNSIPPPLTPENNSYPRFHANSKYLKDDINKNISNENNNLNNIYKGPYKGNVTRPTKEIVYKGKEKPTDKIRDCFDQNDVCGVF